MWSTVFRSPPAPVALAYVRAPRECAGLQDPGVHRAPSEEPDTVRVRVSDDGAGIPEGVADTLFEPFYRLDPSRSRKTGGYGLGLSICRRIMEAHGGAISAESPVADGRGARFILTFPRNGAPS